MFAFLRRLWPFARPYQTRLFLGLLCAGLYALTNAALVLVIKLVINVVFPGTASVSIHDQLAKLPGFIRHLAERFSAWFPMSQSPSSKLGIVLIIAAIPVVMLLRALFGYLNIYCMFWAATRTVGDIRTKLFEHLQNQSLDFFTSARTGELISRIINDTQVLHSIIGNTLASTIKDPITVVCLLAVLFTQQPTLTLISMLVLPLCLLPMIIYGRKVRSSARALQSHAADLSSLMHESFTGNRIIKAYNLEEQMVGQFRATTGKYISHSMRVLRSTEISGQVTELLGGIGAALVFVYMVFFADKSQTSPGDFVAFIGSIFLMYQPVKTLTRLSNQFEQARAASERVFEYLDTISSVQDPATPEPLKAAGADIHFDNIDFAYGSKLVLHGINLTVHAGELVALVGSSGSGKTTLTNLLLRFYDPQHGTVRIGGTDIRNVAIKDLRRQVALVAQETILFNDTVRQNILAGRPTATDTEVQAAAKNAYAHEFISQQPQDYNTIVGEKGAALSGGQRQRLAIARALLKDAPVLVLDEATNALDAKSQEAVHVALEELMQGRTTICIAHRLSTIQRANRIVVLDAGRIVETGTHEELLRQRGVYWKLYQLEFEGGNNLSNGE